MYTISELVRTLWNICTCPNHKRWRKQMIHKHLSKDGLGLEIGPSHRPLAPRREGFNVRILDFLNREDLIRKYNAIGMDVSEIEEVDYVWRGESYEALVDGKNVFDWIISSHSIEHTPDFLGFLKNCQDVLKIDGVLALAIPDKRFCFDQKRDVSTLASIVDAHVHGYTRPSAGSIADFHLKSIKRSGRITWTNFSLEQFRRPHRRFSNEDAAELMQQAITGGEYLDAHVWAFTPTSFVQLIKDLQDLKILVGWEILNAPVCREYEFMISLRKVDSLP